MQLSSILKHLPKKAASVDVATLSGADAVALLRLLNPAISASLALRDAVAARAVDANQHHASGAKSGPSSIGSEAGVSEKSARGILARQKALVSLPDVQEKVRSGELPPEKAEVIVGAAAGDAPLARELLDEAEGATVEDLRQPTLLVKSITTSPAPTVAATTLKTCNHCANRVITLKLAKTPLGRPTAFTPKLKKNGRSRASKSKRASFFPIRVKPLQGGCASWQIFHTWAWTSQSSDVDLRRVRRRPFSPSIVQPQVMA